MAGHSCPLWGREEGDCGIEIIFSNSINHNPPFYEEYTNEK